MRFTRFASTLGCVALATAGCGDDDYYYRDGVASEAGFALECSAHDDTVHLRLTVDVDFVDNSYGRTEIGWNGPRRPAWVVDAVYPEPRFEPEPPPPFEREPWFGAGEDFGPYPDFGPRPPGEPPPPHGPGPHGPPPAPHEMGPKRGRGAMPPPPAPRDPPGPGPAGDRDPGPIRHTLDDLVASDNAEFVVTDADHAIVSRFRIDYISRVRSGYASLGVLGGDGDMIIGDPDDIVAWSTSLERNLNELGYAEYDVESPETDLRYTPNVRAPDWEYAVVYDVWLDARLFGWKGFGDAYVASIHASPSKVRASAFGPLPRHCL